MNYNRIFNPIKNQFVNINSIESRYLIHKYLQKGGSSTEQTDVFNLQNLLDLIESQLNLFENNKNIDLDILFFNNPIIKSHIELLRENLENIKQEEKEIKYIDNLKIEEARKLIEKYKIEIQDDDLELERMKELIKNHFGYSLEEIEVKNTEIDEIVTYIVTQYIDSDEINYLISSDKFQTSFLKNSELIIQNPLILKNSSEIYLSTQNNIDELLESGESDLLKEYISDIKERTDNTIDYLKEDDQEDADISQLEIEEVLGGGFNIYLQKGSGIKNWIKNAAKVTLTVGLAIGVAAALTAAMPVVLGAVTGLGATAFVAAGAYAGVTMATSASIGGIVGWKGGGTLRKTSDLGVDKIFYKIKGDEEKAEKLITFKKIWTPDFDSKPTTLAKAKSVTLTHPDTNTLEHQLLLNRNAQLQLLEQFQLPSSQRSVVQMLSALDKIRS